MAKRNSSSRGFLTAIIFYSVCIIRSGPLFPTSRNDSMRYAIVGGSNLNERPVTLSKANRYNYHQVPF